jgi:hypothetical protein
MGKYLAVPLSNLHKLMHRLESEWKSCTNVIGQLENTAKTVRSLICNYRVCSNTLEELLITHHKKQAKHFKNELVEAQEAATSDYQIVEQKFQFTEWDKWSHKEQIKKIWWPRIKPLQLVALCRELLR